jgi:transposase
MDIQNYQWELIEPLLPKKPKRDDGKGRPPKDPRKILNAILWVCRTGAPWNDVPSRYVPGSTAHRYFQEWVQSGVWERVLKKLAEDLKDRGKIDVSECFIDGTFASAKKGGCIQEKLNEAKGPRSWQCQTVLVFLSPYGPPEPALMNPDW